MGIGKKTLSFAERMAGIKKVFKSAYDNVPALKSEMQSQIESKEQSIA